jgi:eukaryotic-like serine/threonine-protein kinase
MIKTAGFVPSVQDKASASVPKGDVIDTSPSNGSSAPKGSTITVDVSSGQAQVKIPTIQPGEPVSQAEAALQQANLQAQVVQDQASTQPQGTIDHTSPTSGTEVQQGSFVKLFVSGGGVAVQSTVGDTVGVAQQKLQQAGFTVKTIFQASNSGAFVSPGTVWNQSPSSGIEAQGSTVTIYVQPQSSTPSTTPSANPSSSGNPTPTGTANPTPTGPVTGSPPANGANG